MDDTLDAPHGVVERRAVEETAKDLVLEPGIWAEVESAHCVPAPLKLGDGGAAEAPGRSRHKNGHLCAHA